MKSIRIALLLVPVLLAGPSCANVKRSIGVRSDPPGAMVYIDGLEVGRTPVDYVPFDFYGTREIALYKDGYLTERRLVKMRMPWYSHFPIDIFSEILLPLHLRDQRQYYFAMTPTLPPPDAMVKRNAEETRDVGLARIESARARSSYKPREYVVESKEKPSVLWGPFFGPPRKPPVETVGSESEVERLP